MKSLTHSVFLLAFLSVFFCGGNGALTVENVDAETHSVETSQGISLQLHSLQDSWPPNGGVPLCFARSPDDQWACFAAQHSTSHGWEAMMGVEFVSEREEQLMWFQDDRLIDTTLGPQLTHPEVLIPLDSIHLRLEEGGFLPFEGEPEQLEVNDWKNTQSEVKISLREVPSDEESFFEIRLKCGSEEILLMDSLLHLDAWLYENSRSSVLALKEAKRARGEAFWRFHYLYIDQSRCTKE